MALPFFAVDVQFKDNLMLVTDGENNAGMEPQCGHTELKYNLKVLTNMAA
jgi:hypothetical protein